MEKSEPAFKPEWLKSSNGVSGNATSNHHASTSSYSNEYGIGVSSRNRLSVVSDRERGSLSSSRRSLSTNGSRSHDKDILGKSRAYSSFGRSNRDREREKDSDFRDRDNRMVLADNGFNDHLDPLTLSRSEKELLRRSRSMVSGRPVDTWVKGVGTNSSSSVLSRGNITGSSFEKDFPSLGVEEKNGRPEIKRVSSPGISTPIQSIPIGAGAIPGVDIWNSVLAEVPLAVGANGSGVTSVSHAAPAIQVPIASSTVTGLNMAETVAQAPSRVRTAPQLPIDTQRIEELTLRQCKQLIPMTPSMTKNSVSSLSEKLKAKGARGGESATAFKIGQKLSSQPVNSAFHAPVRSDITKLSQVGSFQVLNREKNSVSPTAKDGPNVSNVVTPVGLAPASILSLKSPTNQKFKGDSKSATASSSLGSFGEKRLQSQAKDRHEFFNYIRNKTSNSSSGATPESGSVSPSSSSVNSGKLSSAGDHGKNGSSDLKSSENGNCSCEDPDACEESQRFLTDNEETNSFFEPVDPEEKAFLHSLGWDENEEVAALTKEEIDAFIMKHKEELVQSSKLLQQKILLKEELVEASADNLTGSDA
ncbi:uncharacterized protein [Typha latifolia]|uniref:uncharacterized protein n=1 Tax=Typha latifolia TaxID=4733 RepID=UPI003C303563